MRTGGVLDREDFRQMIPSWNELGDHAFTILKSELAGQCVPLLERYECIRMSSSQLSEH